ncbi:Putative niacin/nicotinamide transporter NaiP [Corynebacterium capitovis DSM 44611]|uniref:MFS transporter n=1 Tax=Corynebacterium capitovis TaxID=131081 RepID=UPI0003607C57|nr:MFS transporter [Corynebacterium capitovis]WKD58339.1 Putative niacin/nicotinamide transporter NaiP [Corynebacterium capitovis DSM 44611]
MPQSQQATRFPPGTLSRSARLDSLPVTARHRRLLVGSGIGWALDAMDIGLISFVIAALAVHWDLDTATSSWIASVGFIGMTVGAALGGLLADKMGRKQVFTLTLLVYGLATGASALSESVAVLLLFRFIVGLGLGGELPVASTLVSEFSPRLVRGRMVVLLEAFWAVGWIFAALIGTFVVSSGAQGWRWGLVIGAVPALYAMYVRRSLPESVRFLERAGREEEAEAIVRDFERAAEIVPGGTRTRAPEPVADAEERPVGGIWGRTLRRRTAAFWVVWICVSLAYYGAFIWIPSLLVAQGFSLVTSFTFTLVITLAQLPGYAAAAWLIEVWGRRSTLAVFLAGSAISAVAYGAADSPWQIIAAGCFLSFFNLGAWGALYAIGPELYPTEVRATGTGAGAAFGRIGSIIAPLIVPPLLAFGGTTAVFAVFGAAFAIACAAAFALPEKRGASLS